MGYGEYGGNGSIHYYGMNGRDRNHGNGQNPHNYHEVDNYPSETGNFTITVYGLDPNRTYRTAGDGTLTIEVAIRHDDRIYTKQVLVEWPDPPRPQQP
jgi:hypothetical protein